MKKIHTRWARFDEEHVLRHIWEKVFRSADDELFFRNYFEQSMCLTALFDDEPAAAGYLLPVGNYRFGERKIPCAMIYAVATLPEHRRQGYGSEVVRELLSAGHRAGFPVIVICPSSDGLFEYYSKHSGFRDWFYLSELSYRSPLPVTACAGITEIDASEYMLLRDAALVGIPHIEMDKQSLEYQILLSKQYGGGLYHFATTNGAACAVVEVSQEGIVWIKEFLSHRDSQNEVLAAIANHWPATEYCVRFPAQGPGPGVRRFGMISALNGFFDSLLAENVYPWYGLAFD